MENLPDVSRAAASHFSGQKPQNKPKKTDKAPCSTFLENVCVFLFLGEGYADEFPDLKTSVTDLGSIRKTVREKTNAHSMCYKGIQQKQWEAFPSLGARVYIDLISKTVWVELDPCKKNASKNPPSKKPGQRQWSKCFYPRWPNGVNISL